jgi:quercetin dioxygenase-like cupin family protein
MSHENGQRVYQAGDVIIVSAQERHALYNTGDQPLRQLCVFAGEPETVFVERDAAREIVDVFNEWP